MNGKNRLLLEEIHGKADAIIELQKALARVPRDLEEMSTTLKIIDSDLKDIIKALGCDPQKDERPV